MQCRVCTSTGYLFLKRRRGGFIASHHCKRYEQTNYSISRLAIFANKVLVASNSLGSVLKSLAYD